MAGFIGTAFNLASTAIGGPYAKLILYAGAAVFVAGTIFTLVHVHDENVKIKATEKYNAEQIAQNAADTKKYKDQLETIAQAQVIILNKAQTQNAAVKTKADTVRYYLGTPAAKAADRPSSEILKETIKRLGAK